MALEYGGGLQFLTDTLQDAHPIAAHFPIALLVVSAGVTVYYASNPAHICSIRRGCCFGWARWGPSLPM